MRRAIAAAVMSGLVLGGALTTPAFAMDHGAGKAAGTAHQAEPAKQRSGTSAKKPKTAAKTGDATTSKNKAARTLKAKPAKTAAAATKTVVYAGYELDVPASWPVYRVDEKPRNCVRYDVHAVYPGPPGPNMNCPSGLVGRTESVSIVPGSGGAARSGASLTAGTGGEVVSRVSAGNASVRENYAQGALDGHLG